MDDKVIKLDKDVYAIGQLVVHLKGDVCWVKKHLEDNAETESESESEEEENKEKEKVKKKKESSSEFEDSETESEEAVDKPK